MCNLFAIIVATPALLDELFAGFYNSRGSSSGYINSQSSRRSGRQLSLAIPDGTKRYKEICRVLSNGAFIQPGAIPPPCPY